MKKLEKRKQKEINGGATHYHWRCDTHSYTSVKYTKSVSAQNEGNLHEDRYGSICTTYVLRCTNSNH